MLNAGAGMMGFTACRRKTAVMAGCGREKMWPWKGGDRSSPLPRVRA